MKRTRQSILIGLSLPLLLAVSGCGISGNIAVFATATPSRIAAGQSSQLDAGVQPGDLATENPVIRPIHCSWYDQPPGMAPRVTHTLSSTTICNPVATPNVTTSYAVDISDSSTAPNRASAGVTVTVSAPSSFTLTVVNNISTIPRSVISYPIGGILCPSTCVASFQSGTTVTIYESVQVNANWQGCLLVDNNGTRCTVVMDADKTVTVSP